MSLETAIERLFNARLTTSINITLRGTAAPNQYYSITMPVVGRDGRVGFASHDFASMAELCSLLERFVIAAGGEVPS